MELRDRAMAALVARQPRQSVACALEILLLEVPVARAAGLFQVEASGTLSLFASARLDQRDLDRVEAGWEDAHVSIRAGGTYSDDGYILVPLGPRGLLYVGGEDGQAIAVPDLVLAQLGAVMRTALAAAQRPAFFQPPDQRSPAEVAREQLLLLLQRNEWNVSRVARLRGVTRLTIYKQMKRHGIERRRVAKSRRADTQ